MNEFERLSEFYPFDDDILARAEHEARRQESATWPEYVRRYDIPYPQIFMPHSGKPVEIMDIRPRDYENTIVYHQPMACPIDPNIALHISTLAALHPENRVIAVGNPGPPGKGYGKLTLSQAAEVWRGDMAPAATPALEYLNSRNIAQADHIGESYGADKAASAAELAPIYDTETARTVMIEPVSVIKTGIVKLGLVFQSTSRHADEYLEPVRQRSRTLRSAESLRYRPNLYPLGVVGRLSNLAIAHALGLNGFEDRINHAMEANPRLKAGIAWGTNSEFDRQNRRYEITQRLISRYSRDRVVPMPIQHQTHAMNLDIFLSAAIYAQLLKETR